MPSLSLWHALCDTWTHQHIIESMTTYNPWQYNETCLWRTPPISREHFSIHIVSIGILLFDLYIWNTIQKWGMFWKVSYHWNGIWIPEWTDFSFNINITIFLSAFKFTIFFHVCHQLIELFKVFVIGNRFNKSSFEDVVQVWFTLVHTYNWTTQLPLMGYTNHCEGVADIMLNRLCSYWVVDWSSCIGKHFRLRLVDG